MSPKANRIEITLSDAKLAALDAKRKREPRASFIKHAIDEAISGTRELWNAVPLRETILAVLSAMPEDAAPEHLAVQIESQVRGWLDLVALSAEDGDWTLRSKDVAVLERATLADAQRAHRALSEDSALPPKPEAAAAVREPITLDPRVPSADATRAMTRALRRDIGPKPPEASKPRPKGQL